MLNIDGVSIGDIDFVYYYSERRSQLYFDNNGPNEVQMTLDEAGELYRLLDKFITAKTKEKLRRLEKKK